MPSVQHRILVSTSRSLSPSSAWGQALKRLQAEGHKVVMKTGALQAGTEYLGSPIRLIADSIRSLSSESSQILPRAVDEYVAYRFSNDYAETHLMLLLMMSRVDSTGTFRLLEREVLLRKMHLEIFSALAEAKPTLAIFDDTPHEAMDFALMRVLEWYQTPLLMFQSSLVGPQVMARASLTEVIPLEIPSDVASSHKLALNEVHRIADESIQRLALGAGTPKMDNQKATEARVGTVPARLRAVRYSANRIIAAIRDTEFALTGHSGIGKKLRALLELFLERSLRRSLGDRIRQIPSLQVPPSNRFALFALHYEPERSSTPEGYPFDSQLDAIAAARKLLPEEVTLCVKEHFSQRAAALRGYVGRSPDFYDLLNSIPGVMVLGTETNTRALIKAAECVMTFTGKVGIEAALEGTRVVFLGQPWWEDMPGARSFHKLSNYAELLSVPMPRPSEVLGWITRQVRHSLLPGLSSVSPERHSKRIAQLPDGFEELEAAGIVVAVHATMIRAAGAF